MRRLLEEIFCRLVGAAVTRRLRSYKIDSGRAGGSIAVALLAALALPPSVAKAESFAGMAVDSVRQEAWVDSVFSTLTPDERLGQLIIPIVETKGNTAAQRQIILRDIRDYHVGGLLFGASNVADQAAMTRYAQRQSRVPLWITQDGEWGLAMRLRDATRFPKNMTLGCINDTPNENGVSLRDSLLYEYGREVARQCRAMGIHVNFAPVLDINSNPDNPVIGNRAFGDTPEVVTACALAYATGLRAGRVLPVGKHFPGHGDADQDSHKTLPALLHDTTRLHDFELRPFEAFAATEAGGIMVGHLALPALDKADTPSSLSQIIVEGVLRKQIGFGGLVFTDGMAMEAVRRVPEAAVTALLAGADILLDPVPIGKQWQLLKAAVAEGRLPQSLVDAKCRKVLRYKFATAAPAAPSEGAGEPSPTRTGRGGTQLSRELYAASLCVLKNDTIDGDTPVLPLRALDRHPLTLFNVGDRAENAFARTVRRYAPVATYAYTAATSDADGRTLVGKASAAGRAIIAIYDDKAATVDFARSLCAAAKTNYILCFFTNPYKLTKFGEAIAGATAVLLAHEDCVTSNEVAGEALFGGCAIGGQLSVTIPGLFSAGTGFHYPRIRPCKAEPETVGIDSRILERIDSIVQDGIDQRAFPGCQILVAKDGYVIYNRAFGHYDYSRRRAVTTESVYDLASVSKAAATIPALMLAHDECHLRLSDRLSAYVPKLKNTDKATLTIREALYHETGMRDSYPFYQMTFDTTGIRRLYSNRRDATFSIRADKNLWFNHNVHFDTAWVAASADAAHPLQVAEACYLNAAFPDSILQKIIDLPLQRRGTYRYSCLNFVLLRRLIEQVTRQPMDEYLRHRLFAPLGASTLCYNPHQTLGAAADTLVVPTEEDEVIRHQTLCGYVHDEIAAFSGGVEGNAGLFGSAQDLYKVLQWMLDGGTAAGERYVSEETCRLYTGSKSPKSRRGLGFDKPDIKRPDHSPTAPECPATTYGHTGYTGTCFWIDPDNRLIYIFLCNRIHPHRWNTTLTRNGYRTKIQSLLYEAIATNLPNGSDSDNRNVSQSPVSLQTDK